jgi:Recombination endonuclease VII
VINCPHAKRWQEAGGWAQGRNWRNTQGNPGGFCPTAQLPENGGPPFGASLKKFGLTKSKFEVMLTEQGGRCALCDEPLTSGWVIDHDHLTMGVRGLLHTNCNALLGFGNEDPQRFESAISYLKKHNKFLRSLACTGLGHLCRSADSHSKESHSPLVTSELAHSLNFVPSLSQQRQYIQQQRQRRTQPKIDP